MMYISSELFWVKCFLVTSFLVMDVSAFCNKILLSQTFSRNYERPFQSEESFKNSFQQYALIFGSDGERSDDEYTSIDYVPDYYPQASTGLAEKLTLDPDQLASLSRLACAFSPPDHSLSLRDLEQVRVIAIDENHIELSAVVCEEEGCVTILVPVQFPHECGASGDDMEECVLENIVDLDHQAEEVLNEKAKISELDTEDAVAEWCELTDDKVDEDFPSWWIAPSSCTRGMEQECAMVRQLLNNVDFQEEVKALAQRGLESMQELYSTEAEYTVHRAAVVAVGPAGFFLRAKVSVRRSIFDDNVEFRKINIPFEFSRNEVLWSAEDLRAAVLGAVASANNLNM